MTSKPPSDEVATQGPLPATGPFSVKTTIAQNVIYFQQNQYIAISTIHQLSCLIWLYILLLLLN